MAYAATTLQATGGQSPYRWTASGLPNLLTLAFATGVLSGTPKFPGTFSVSIRVTDATNAFKTQSYILAIAPAGVPVLVINDDRFAESISWQQFLDTKGFENQPLSTGGGDNGDPQANYEANGYKRDHVRVDDGELVLSATHQTMTTVAGATKAYRGATVQTGGSQAPSSQAPGLLFRFGHVEFDYQHRLRGPGNYVDGRGVLPSVRAKSRVGATFPGFPMLGLMEHFGALGDMSSTVYKSLTELDRQLRALAPKTTFAKTIDVPEARFDWSGTRDETDNFAAWWASIRAIPPGGTNADRVLPNATNPFIQHRLRFPKYTPATKNLPPAQRVRARLRLERGLPQMGQVNSITLDGQGTPGLVGADGCQLIATNMRPFQTAPAPDNPRGRYFGSGGTTVAGDNTFVGPASFDSTGLVPGVGSNVDRIQLRIRVEPATALVAGASEGQSTGGATFDNGTGVVTVDSTLIPIGQPNAGLAAYLDSGQIILGTSFINYTGRTTTSFTGCTRTSGAPVTMTAGMVAQKEAEPDGHEYRKIIATNVDGLPNKVRYQGTSVGTYPLPGTAMGFCINAKEGWDTWYAPDGVPTVENANFDEYDDADNRTTDANGSTFMLNVVDSHFFRLSGIELQGARGVDVISATYQPAVAGGSFVFKTRSAHGRGSGEVIEIQRSPGYNGVYPQVGQTVTVPDPTTIRVNGVGTGLGLAAATSAFLTAGYYIGELEQQNGIMHEGAFDTEIVDSRIKYFWGNGVALQSRGGDGDPMSATRGFWLHDSEVTRFGRQCFTLNYGSQVIIEHSLFGGSAHTKIDIESNSPRVDPGDANHPALDSTMCDVHIRYNQVTSSGLGGIMSIHSGFDPAGPNGPTFPRRIHIVGNRGEELGSGSVWGTGGYGISDMVVEDNVDSIYDGTDGNVSDYYDVSNGHRILIRNNLGQARDSVCHFHDGSDQYSVVSNDVGFDATPPPGHQVAQVIDNDSWAGTFDGVPPFAPVHYLRDNQWRTGVMDWDANSIRFSIDGTVIWTYSGPNVPQVAMYLQFSLAVIGTNSQGLPTAVVDDFDFGAELRINRLVITQQTTVAPLNVASPASLPSGRAGTPYMPTTVVAVGGVSPYRWSATGLPSGLTMNMTTGVLSGTPTANGTFAVVVRVDDNAGTVATRTYALVIDAVIPLVITTPAAIPNGQVTVVYPTQTFIATGGIGAHTWSATGLPPGLTINTTTGALSGTPSSAGSYTIVVRATDASAAFVTRSYPTTIAASPVALHLVGPGALPAGIVGRTITVTTATAAGGTGPYRWAMGGGPPGVTINATTGVITGTPTAAGTYAVTVAVIDALNMIASRAYTMAVVAELVIAALTLPDGDEGEPYPLTVVAATGGNPPYAWSASNLPGGMSIDPTSGAISGTPIAPGDYVISISVTDGMLTDTDELTLHIEATPPPPPPPEARSLAGCFVEIRGARLGGGAV